MRVILRLPDAWEIMKLTFRKTSCTHLLFGGSHFRHSAFGQEVLNQPRAYGHIPSYMSLVKFTPKCLESRQCSFLPSLPLPTMLLCSLGGEAVGPHSGPSPPVFAILLLFLRCGRTFLCSWPALPHIFQGFQKNVPCLLDMESHRSKIMATWLSFVLSSWNHVCL